MRRGVALLVILLFGAAIVGCGSNSHASGTTTRSAFEGPTLDPPRPTPALALRDYTGQVVNLAASRGKVVLVTFVYTHCPDVCPLIVTNLAAARRELTSEARHLQIIASRSTLRATRRAQSSSFWPQDERRGRWTT
jgi:protein SCO1